MIEPLWRFDEVVASCGGVAEGSGRPDIAEVSIDSRTIGEGGLFVAIKGERTDGHAFVAQAFERGAAAAVVRADHDGGAGSAPLVRVADTMAALEALGRAARARSPARVIAVTGSVGKTGTKEALRLALGESGLAHASSASHNNQWGVPLSLARLPRRAQFGVFEIGMNHAGEITPLTRQVRPHVAVITTVEAVHLGYFKSVHDIAEAKAEILLGLEPQGVAVLNRDNDYFALLAERARQRGAAVRTFGRSAEAHVRLRDATLAADGSDVVATIDGRELRYRVGAPGAHLVMNSLAVLAAVDAVGADLDKAAASLARLRAPKGRGERTLLAKGDGRIVLIDESYNANPASMRAALAAMAQTPREAGGRRIAVLGDMLELGESAEELHRALAEPVDAAGVDVVFACGPLMKALFEALPRGRRGAYAATSEELKGPLLASVRAGDVVMVKGSLGSRMGPLVDALKQHNAARGAEE